ncbi:hypothetical protein O181_014181 [Austropuccinia psidii MF-1]|uniref:Uncharacterized protein n=1 Tax=Austropuccinia psidii MF-1 TaxID=1389203 RepID=A0A9Q3BXN9_9BASI|nr:hypothetical protein [Austropuccinia psidii MF-1]
MAQQYKKEAKESGKNAKDEERKATLRARLKVKNLSYKFGVAQGFPQQYLNILSNNDAHSEEKLDPTTNKYIIKQMECRSEEANQFMRRLDEEIEKADRAQKKWTQRRERLLPKDGCASISTYAPEGLPIDFYDPNWFNNRTEGQKRIIADSNSIAFLPDATKSLLGKQHQDERLSNKWFNQKYWEQVIKDYNISHEIVNDDELDDSLTEESDQLAYLEENPIDEAKEESGELEYLIDQDVEMEDSENNNIVQHHNGSFFNLPNEWAP